MAERVAFDPDVTPIPSKEMDWGLPAVSSVIVMDAPRGPNWLGLNVIFTVQFAPAARVAPHVLALWLNSAALFPTIAIPAMFNTELPILLNVSVWAALVLPTTCVAKLKLAGDSERMSGSGKIEIV
jgi:hypothetical protein